MTESSKSEHLVELSSVSQSKITHVSLYAGLAEITRLYHPVLKAGNNKLIISGLPNALVKESLRVEGRGPCTIHEVSISEIPVPPVETTSPHLEDLLRQQTRAEKALYRCKQAISSIERYQSTVDVKHVDAKDLVNVRKYIGGVTEALDERLLDLEEETQELKTKIAMERVALGVVDESETLRKRVSITMVAETEIKVDVALVYGVLNATWDAAYDIYVKMDTKEKPVGLIYKARIMQETGENWDDVALTLETVKPTFGLSIPELDPWTLSTHRPFSIKMDARPQSSSQRRKEEEKKEKLRYRDEDSKDEGSGRFGFLGGAPPMPKRGFLVSSKGDISATFSVPGLITIPSDGSFHNVTITELHLDSVMSWISVPKKDAKAHLTAKIRNESDYSLLMGIASVYVDGSFISRSDVPVVSPSESFDCPLGVDTTIRITYHPRIRKVNRSGFTRKMCNYVYQQRITLFNTKATSSATIKILDQIPVSEEAEIAVNLFSPPLTVPLPNKKGLFTLPKPLKVNDHLTVQWNGGEDPEMDPSLLGKDGKFSWECVMSPQEKVNLLLAWEIVCPQGTDVAGLDGI